MEPTLSPNEVVLDAVHDTRAILLHHVQTKQSREPEKAIEDLRRILESTAVSEALTAIGNGNGH